MIYETFVCRQSHRMKDRTFINVAAENILGYYRNLGSLRYGTSTASCTASLYVLPNCKSLWIKASAKWLNVNVNVNVKTHMGKCLFSPELKSYLITQWNCTTMGSCRCRKTNQWVGSGAARTYGDDTRQYSRRNGWGIWLYKRSFRHRILRFTSTEATTESCSYLARQSTQYSFRISGNRGYDSNRVRSLSILHSYCVL